MNNKKKMIIYKHRNIDLFHQKSSSSHKCDGTGGGNPTPVFGGAGGGFLKLFF